MAGYSETPLLKKLGIKEGFSILVINEPKSYWDDLGRLPVGVQVIKHNEPDSIDYIHIFCKEKDVLLRKLPDLKSSLKKTGMLWVSWPKKSSKVSTDLSDMIVRNTVLEAGLVDIKVCAVDDIWSGLKFVYRKTDR